jgi:predicted ATP-dependent endonuclease of OLD family
LSSEYYRRIEKKDSLVQTIEEFKKLVTETDVKLNSIYQGVFGGIIDKIRTFGGIKEGDTDVKILSSLQSRELLKGNTTVKYTHDENYQLPENYNGLGYLNLIGMIFEIEVILSEFRKDGKANEMPADINLFFIEEPEAHTHPQMQYVFINNIKSILVNGSQIEGGEVINLQSIISTHSSHIVSESDFDDIKYFYIAKDKYVKAKNLKSLEVEYKKDGDEGVQRFKFLKQYLTLHRSELFFADKAIFIEGETERILLPSIMKKIDQEKSNENSLPLCSQNISIIEVGNYSHIFDRFIDFIGVKSLIITDIDPAKPYEKKETNSNVSEHTPLTKCKSKDATTTTNASLRHYFAYYLTDKENAFCRLRNLDTSQKSLIKSNSDTFGWESSDSGNLMVVFQVEEKTTDTDTSYLAGSFEDAFIYLNRQFIKGNQKIFQSLKNKEYFDDSQKDAWDLAQKCIDKKTSFAIEIILASNDRSDNWTIPKYIKEGLIWLKKN